MAPIDALQAQSAAHQIAKRSNWASRESGVIVVFCIVFIVAVGLIGLYVTRAIQRRRNERASRSTV
jgi:hypothetical protein